MINRKQAALAFLAAVLLSGCGEKAADGGKVLATVNNETISERDFEDYRRLRERNLGPIADKAAEKRILLEELINRTLLARHAADLKLDRDPDVAMLLRRLRQDILIDAVTRKLQSDQPITDEDLKKRFQEEVDKTPKTERRVRHILFKEEEQARKVIGELERGGNFTALARKHSIDKDTSPTGGDLGWIHQGMPYVPEFLDAAMKLEKNQFTRAPVKTEFGFHVIRVDDTRPVKLPGYEEFMATPNAKERLRAQIQRGRLETLLKDLRAKAGVKTTE